MVSMTGCIKYIYCTLIAINRLGGEKNWGEKTERGIGTETVKVRRRRIDISIDERGKERERERERER